VPAALPVSHLGTAPPYHAPPSLHRSPTPPPAQKEGEERRGRKRMSKEARAASAALELYAYCTQGPPDAPAFDAEAEAAAAVTALLRADVVITTYSVLQAEVHLAPNHADGVASRALRRPKRYRVPESPLLQVRRGAKNGGAQGWGCRVGGGARCGATGGPG
jgi:hypothetical protein